MSYYPGYDEEEETDVAASKPKAPPTPEAIQCGVQVLQHAMTGVWLEQFLGKGLSDQVPAESLLNFAMGFRAELKPRDKLEELLVDSALLMYFKAMQLMVEANSSGVQRADICLKAAPKFVAEFRKCMLALKEYRSPVVAKQVTVVQQQNVAQGDQQVACVVADATAMKDAAVAATRLKKMVADLPAPVAAIAQQTKTVDDLIFESFVANKEVQQQMAMMEAASTRQSGA